MIKFKLKEIANIYNGYSNELKPGKDKISFVGLKQLSKGNEPIVGEYSLRVETKNKLKISKDTILISSVGWSTKFKYGAKYVGSIAGKGLYKVELTSEEIPIQYLMAILKINSAYLPYEGNTIKILKIKDLENFIIPVPSEEIMESIANMEKYRNILKKQNDDIELYTKAIVRGIYEKNN